MGRAPRRRPGRGRAAVHRARPSLAVVADAIGPIIGVARREEEVAHLVHRAEALRRVASDIGSRLDLDRILAGLVDHAMVLFEGDRAAVFLRRDGGRPRGRQPRPVARVPDGDAHGPGPLPAGRRHRRPAAAVRGRPIATTRAASTSGPRSSRRASTRSARAPLMDGTELLGMLNVYHDTPHAWTDDELDSIAALATQASVAIRAAQNFQQMATWTAQLQSIQQLGARLSHLSTVREIGLAIATELRQIIDYHNVRVYRLVGTDLIPVAMQGQVGEYIDETPDQLRVALGEGITGWVAEHRIAQNLPDAAADPRANTIPGTEDDLDESMLLAPMLFEEQVLGVLVLSKLGLDQFTDDDLRLLVIYANFAAQAMANADTTQRLREQSAALERQLRSQRELLSITESILTTLDARAVLEIDHRPHRRAHRLRQHRHRGRRPGDRPPDPADGAGPPRRAVPGAVGGRRDRPRAVGRRAQRAGVRLRPAPRPAGQPLPRGRSPSTAASSSSRCAVATGPSAC